MRVWCVLSCLGHTKDIRTHACLLQDLKIVEKVSSQCDKFSANCTPLPYGRLYNAGVCVLEPDDGKSQEMERKEKKRQENRDMRKIDRKGERQRHWERWDSETPCSSIPLGTPIYWHTFPHVTKEMKKLPHSHSSPLERLILIHTKQEGKKNKYSAKAQ